MKSLSRIGSFILAFVGVLSFASCQFEREIVDNPDPNPVEPVGEAEISFLAQIPEATVVSTRGETGTEAENKIDNIYVLVFDTTSGDLVYKGKGKELAFSGTNKNSVTFKATLPVGATYDFMVLANAETMLEDGGIVITEPAKTKTDVQAILQRAVSSGGGHEVWSAPIPMWDEQRLTLSTSTGAVFNLMRMMARINVKYEQESGTESRFHLTHVRYYNYNTAGKPVPVAANLTGTGADRYATAVSLPADPGTQIDKSLSYTATDDACENRIYVFEAANKGKYEEANPADAANWIGNPCLVVGGKYDTDNDNNYEEETTTWYRIDFIRSSDDTWLSILRNFTYNVAITSVSGQGYSDPDIALKSAPMNMTAGVIDWNDGDMDEVLFDGTAYLSVDRNEFRFERGAVSGELTDGSNVLQIKTDYKVNGYPANSGWKAEYYTDPAGTVAMTDPWLKLVHADGENEGDPTGTPDDSAAITHFEFTENNSPENREAWVYIVAGRLRYRVHVIQRLLSLEIVDPDSGDTPTEEMFFVVPRESGSGGRPSTTRRFTVNWTPVADNVTTGNESPRVWTPFAPTWITGTPANTLPAPDATGSITNGTGTQRYTVTAPAVTDAEIALDPFYERESNYTFMIDNGLDPGNPSYDYVQKSINLHQIYYNIIVDTYKYRLDGGTSTVTVRSNTEWVVTNVEEWLYNEDPATASPTPTEPILLDLKTYDNLRVGTEGGPNVNGEALAFTTVNNEGGPHDGKWGTVWVTFHSPTGKFPDQRVALPFPAASKLIMGLGETLDVRNYNIATSTPYHQNSAFKMLSSPYNFGSMEESVYKVEGLRMIAFNAESKSRPSEPASNPDYEWHVNSFKNWLNDYNPDVIVVSGNPTNAMEFNANELRLLKEYLNNGGSVVMCYHGYPNADRVAGVLGAVFGRSLSGGSNYTTSDVHYEIGAGQYFALESGSQFENDPILNGPFGDIRGKDWGAHYHTASVKTSLIAGHATTLSTANDGSDSSSDGSNYSIVFRHNTLNFMFIGNACAMASYYDYYQTVERYHDPFVLDKDNFFFPKARPGFGGSSPYTTTYNSFLIANSVAWALSVSNHIPPAVGYN